MSIDPTLQLDELSHLFGCSKQVRYLPSQAIATSLGREKAGVSQTFHAPAGYNTFQVERNEDGVERVGHVLRANSFPKGAADVAGQREHTDDICLDVIARFAILSYNRPSGLCKVNEVKQELFSRKARSPERILRTQESLLDLNRGVFQ